MKIAALETVLLSLESGSRPKGGVSADSGDIPSLGGEHVNADGGFNFTNIKRIPHSFFEKMRSGIIQPNDILIVKDGATTGKTSLVRDDFPFEEAAVNEHVFCVRVDPTKALPAYIYHFLYSDLGQKAIQLDFRGATVGGISREFAKKTFVPLPPLEKQRRITEVLDRAEELRSKRREAIAQLDTLTQAIFLEMFGDPVTNPKGWISKSLTDVCYCYSGGTPSKNNDAYWQGSLPWFSAKDMKFSDLFDSQDHINEDIPAKTTLKLLPENTVAIVVRGMILAHTFPISVLRIPATINQDLKALLPNQPLEPQLLAASLRSVAAFALQQVSEAAHGTKRLDAEGLRKIPIILPPLPLQQEFARRAEAVEKLKAAHRASLSDLNALFASLQDRAFRGEL